MFLVISTFGFLQPFVPLFLEASGLDRREIGLVLGIATGLALLIQPLLGRLSDRLDRRRPFVVFASAAAGAAYLCFPLAEGLPALLLLSAIGANATLYLNAAGGVIVGRLVASERGGAAYAGYRVFGSIGYICVSLLTGALLLLGYGPRAGLNREELNVAFHFAPLLFFLITGLAFLLPDPRARPNAEQAASRGVRAPWTPNLVWFLIAFSIYTMALYGASSFLSLYMKQLGANALWITGTFAAGVVCEVLVMRQSGRLADRYGRRPLLMVTFLLLPVRLTLYALVATPGGVLLVQLLHGLNFGIMGAVAVAFINDLATDRTRGQLQGRLAAAGGLATAVAPIGLGIVAEGRGLPTMFVVAAGVAALGALVFVFFVKESLRKPGTAHASEL